MQAPYAVRRLAFAVMEVRRIADLLVTSLGAQSSVKLTGHAVGCQSDCLVRRKFLRLTNALTTARSTALCPSDEDFELG